MTEQATIDRLVEAVSMLRETWLEVSSIQHGRALLEAARPGLASFADYAAFIRQWHYDSTLSAARRMLDERKDVRSAVRGLQIIASKIEQLDDDGLVALHAATRDTHRSPPTPKLTHDRPSTRQRPRTPKPDVGSPEPVLTATSPRSATIMNTSRTWSTRRSPTGATRSPTRGSSSASHRSTTPPSSAC